jgi:acyl-CoA thioester hydrolase
MNKMTFQVGWGETDFNGHMRNTAYLDLAATARLRFFTTQGFSTDEFLRLRFGPVVMSDTINYRREVRLLETVEVSLALAGLASDGSRFCIHNAIVRGDGEEAARVVSLGGWLNLQTRRLQLPPTALLNAMQALPRTRDYTILPSSCDTGASRKRLIRPATVSRSHHGGPAGNHAP